MSSNIDLSPKPKTLEKFQRVYISNEVKDTELAHRFTKYFSADKLSFVDEIPYSSNGSLSAKEFDRSKRELFLTKFKGKFFKRCPGFRPGLTCCNYFVLNLGQQCDMNCSYCYLQSFINSPVTHVYQNISEALVELNEIYQQQPKQKFRVGTGEVIDSLSIDDLTLFSRQLIEFFKDKTNWQLEFKTKSSNVDQFLDLGPAKNVIVSWSINPDYIIKTEEHGTAGLQERLAAAKKCLDAGFQVAFHIDPMIWHPEWKENYKSLVVAIANIFSFADVPYISVGTLRYQPEQRHIMRERFSMDSWTLKGEMFRGDDGKLRYDKTVREEMFRFLIEEFRKVDSSWKIFMCMETPETWLNVEKKLPKQIETIKGLFDYKPIKEFENFSGAQACK